MLVAIICETKKVKMVVKKITTDDAKDLSYKRPRSASAATLAKASGMDTTPTGKPEKISKKSAEKTTKKPARKKTIATDPPNAVKNAGLMSKPPIKSGKTANGLSQNKFME